MLELRFPRVWNVVWWYVEVEVEVGIQVNHDRSTLHQEMAAPSGREDRGQQSHFRQV